MPTLTLKLPPKRQRRRARAEARSPSPSHPDHHHTPLRVKVIEGVVEVAGSERPARRLAGAVLHDAELAVGEPVGVRRLGALLRLGAEPEPHLGLERAQREQPRGEVAADLVEVRVQGPRAVAEQAAVVGVALDDDELVLVQALREGARHVPHGLGLAPERVRLDLELARAEEGVPDLAQGLHACVGALLELIYGMVDVVRRRVRYENGILLHVQRDLLGDAEGHDAVREHHVRHELHARVVRDDAHARHEGAGVGAGAVLGVGHHVLANVSPALLEVVVEELLLARHEHRREALGAGLQVLLVHLRRRRLLRLLLLLLRVRVRLLGVVIRGRRPKAEVELVAPERT
mmetsp:Transcript_26330/g.82002  ORF Transcript_26330/g.82002 Transcript_26330/m.82002 type:complete len:347 (+) Transcript_26330:57-1097(+)